MITYNFRIFADMKIGNILTEGHIEAEKAFNVVSSIDDCIDGIPTLIVGHYVVKEMYEDLNFLDRKVNEQTFWTFTEKEQRKYHVIDIDAFKDHCFHVKLAKMNYVFVDPIQSKLSKIKKILKKLYSLEDAITYIHLDKVAYVYADDLIFGIDLKLLKYIGIDESKIKSRLKTISAVTLEQSEILIEYKNYMERLGGQVKYIPFLYSISNDE